MWPKLVQIGRMYPCCTAEPDGPFVLGNSAPVDSAARPVPIRGENSRILDIVPVDLPFPCPARLKILLNHFEDPPDCRAEAF